VTVRLYVPTETLAWVVMSSVTEPLPDSVAGVKLAEVFAGRPVSVNVAVAAQPVLAADVTV
jgi:hypothetical protein